MTSVLALSLTLVRPWWLLVLAAAPLFWWITYRASRGKPRAAEWTALTVRTVLLALIALALAAPRMSFEASTRSVAYVLDMSESVPPAALQRMQEYIARSVPLRSEDDDAAFVVFADGAAVETPFSRISSSQRVDSMVIDPENVTTVLPRGESDIEAALGLARASFPPGGARRILLFTDGSQTRGDALGAIEALVADGVDVQLAPVRYQRDREVHVRKLVAPARASKGRNLPVRAVVMSTHDGVSSRIRFAVDGQEVTSREVTLDAGSNVFELGTTFQDTGNHELEVTVEPSSGFDSNPANNVGLAVTQVRGDPRVLVVSTEEESPLATTLATVLDATVEVTGPEGVPANAAELVSYDGIVLENVPAWLLSPTQKKYLAYAVEELGIGLVCIGGIQTYGPGAYAGTPLEELLPVSSEVKQKRVLPSGALVVILHTCEFPGGNKMGRDVTILALRALSVRDEFGVINYSMTGDNWVVPLQVIRDKQRLAGSIESANPGDMPAFGPSMKMAEKALARSTAATKHMIIISDGDATPPSPKGKLEQRLVDQRITVTTVAVDPHGGAPTYMKNLAADTGGRFYGLKSSQKDRIPHIFIKEAVTVRRSAWKEDPFQVSVAGVHDMIRHFAEEDFRPLRGHVVTTLKPDAELILAGPEADPILATWRYGLGEVVAWTSDASKRWAQDWMGWSGYGRFWGQVLRSTMRAVQQPGLRMTTDVEGGTAHVQLDALEPDGDFMNGLTLRGRFLSPDGDSGEFDVTQTGPGRYEGKFQASQVGVHLATLTYVKPDSDEPPLQINAGACVAYSAEHLAQSHDERFFARAEGLGATILDLDALERAHADDPTQPDAAALPWMGEARSTDEPLDLWPWIAGFAAFLLVIDVAVRRVRWKFPALGKRAAALKDKAVETIAKGKPKAPEGHFRPEHAPAVQPDKGGDESDKGDAPPPPPEKAGGLLDAKRRAKKRQDWEDN